MVADVGRKKTDALRRIGLRQVGNGGQAELTVCLRLNPRTLEARRILRNAGFRRGPKSLDLEIWVRDDEPPRAGEGDPSRPAGETSGARGHLVRPDLADQGIDAGAEREEQAARADRVAVEKHGISAFEALMGADAVRELLNRLALDEVAAELRDELNKTRSKQKIKDLSKRLKIVEQIRNSENDLRLTGSVVRASERDMGVRFVDMSDEQKWSLRKEIREGQPV